MLPTDFIRQIKALFGNEAEALAKALETSPTTSIRRNPHKNIPPPSSQKAVPWCSHGYYLEERPVFIFDPLFHAGTYYVQEASSMFLEQALKTIQSQISLEECLCLDLCAAPGGKSTHAVSLLPENSLLVCNEIVKSRANILNENIMKWGYPNCIVTNNAPADFACLPDFFDIIIADLPCSGEGMFRKDIASRDEWSIANVKMCAERQRKIVQDIWPTLKSNGFLIYSTCTFNRDENEDNIEWLAQKLDADIIEIPTKEGWDIGKSIISKIPAYKFLPHRTCGEGFFLALLHKKEGQAKRTKTKLKHKNGNQPKPLQMNEWLLHPDIFYSITFGQNCSVCALPHFHHERYHTLAERLRISSFGIHIGNFKGKDFIPSASLALSTQLNPKAFPQIELPLPEAIKYLQKEAVNLPADSPNGFALITHQQVPLGFVKNLGNRANNLYPQEWRIRKKP